KQVVKPSNRQTGSLALQMPKQFVERAPGALPVLPITDVLLCRRPQVILALRRPGLGKKVGNFAYCAGDGAGGELESGPELTELAVSPGSVLLDPAAYFLIALLQGHKPFSQALDLRLALPERFALLVEGGHKAFQHFPWTGLLNNPVAPYWGDTRV